MPRRLVFLVAFGLVVLGGTRASSAGSVGLAQEATPAASPIGDPPAPDVPDPAECRAAPRSLASLQALATPAAGLPQPTLPAPAAGTPLALPDGDPANAVVVAALAATAREVIACDNAGETLRTLALYSDDYLRPFFGQPGTFTPDRHAALATPRPVEALLQVALVEVRDALLLPDGRAAAVVVVDDPADPTGEPRSASLLYFVAQDGRWLVDDAVEGIAAGAAGTPVAERGSVSAAPSRPVPGQRIRTVARSVDDAIGWASRRGVVSEHEPIAADGAWLRAAVRDRDGACRSDEKHGEAGSG